VRKKKPLAAERGLVKNVFLVFGEKAGGSTKGKLAGK